MGHGQLVSCTADLQRYFVASRPVTSLHAQCSSKVPRLVTGRRSEAEYPHSSQVL